MGTLLSPGASCAARLQCDAAGSRRGAALRMVQAVQGLPAAARPCQAQLGPPAQHPIAHTVAKPAPGGASDLPDTCSCRLHAAMGHIHDRTASAQPVSRPHAGAVCIASKTTGLPERAATTRAHKAQALAPQLRAEGGSAPSCTARRQSGWSSCCRWMPAAGRISRPSSQASLQVVAREQALHHARELELRHCGLVGYPHHKSTPPGRSSAYACAPAGRREGAARLLSGYTQA